MTLSTRRMDAADWIPLEPYFTPAEFTRPEMMGVEFMDWLLQVRVRAAVPMHITSSYRDPERNEAVGGASDSAHCDIPCEAVDIGKRPRPDDPHWNYSRWRIITAAVELGCRRIGIYPNGSLHLDRSEHKRPHPRLWVMVDHPAA